jgi:hypothetical protein
MARKVRNGPTPHPITLIENLVLSNKSTTYWELPKNIKTDPPFLPRLEEKKKKMQL